MVLCVIFGQKTLGIHPDVIYSKNYYLFIRKCAQLGMTQKIVFPDFFFASFEMLQKHHEDEAWCKDLWNTYGI